MFFDWLKTKLNSVHLNVSICEESLTHIEGTIQIIMFYEIDFAVEIATF